MAPFMITMRYYYHNIMIRNQQAGGSTPPVGSIHFKGISAIYALIPFFILKPKMRQIGAK